MAIPWGHPTTGCWIADARLLARVVDEQLFAGPMYLPHAEPTSVAPVRVQLAELAVRIRSHTALLGSRFVLAPQQLQRDPDAAQLPVKPRRCHCQSRAPHRLGAWRGRVPLLRCDARSCLAQG